ncbi:MAG TPA: response regulator [Candidatus Acidoferrum sp.]|nr:response regulator [Candidatus Acidoferrum sp.]
MGSDANIARAKIMLVDDDQDFLEVYWEILKGIPIAPEVHTASTGARALALLESEPFNLLIVDLNMPKMDGLQVIAIARRKYPRLRIVVWTAIADEQFRARAYGMGVDQYWQKPGSDDDRKHFIESIETLLQHEAQGGFRGVQSKSLVDLIQLECLSQNSTLLRISNGTLNGKIWIESGEVVDAETSDLKGEAAFRAILGWKAGNFELLPGVDGRERTIFSSYHALLLEVAQALDEAGGGVTPLTPIDPDAPTSPLMALTRFSGVQWVLSVGAAPKFNVQSWGLETPDQVSDWATESLKSFAELGDKLQAGPLQQITAMSASNHVAFADSIKGELCVGFRSTLKSDEVRESMRNILAKWLS